MTSSIGTLSSLKDRSEQRIPQSRRAQASPAQVPGGDLSTDEERRRSAMEQLQIDIAAGR